MRLSVLFSFVFALQLMAIGTEAQNTIMKINSNVVTVAQLINEIEKQTDYLVVFSNREVNIQREIRLQRQSNRVSSFLAEAFNGTDISYEFENNYIILAKKDMLKKTVIALAQQNGKRITGTVTDAKGEPIIGANVVVKGTTNGTVSDIDGKFSLESIPNNAVLEVSYIGYLSQEIKVGNQSVINAILNEDTQKLDEVVVVGYGVQKKINLTGSISSVKYDQALENRPITDPSQALSGKVTGVWVSQNSGAPGSDGATIRVRGYGTLNNTNPLILIDGVEGRLSELAPNDIASITVLKDAASAAIYGSRAANGVVLVETKKGSGDKASINYTGYFGVQKLGRRYDLISDSPEYMELWNKAFVNSGSSELFPQDVIDAFKNGNDPYKYPSTNYFDEVFRTAFTTQHNLSATFGGKNSTSYIDLGYLDNNGIVKNTNSERYSLTINNETKVSKWLRIGARARLMRKTTNMPYDGISRVIYMMANGHPFSTPYLQDGKTFGGTQALYVSGSKAGQPIVDTRNPFPDLYNGKSQTINNFMKGNAYAIIDFMKGLSLTAQYSGQYNNNNNDKYNQLLYCYTDLDGSNKSKPLDYPSTLYVYRKVTDEYYGTFFANLNFNRTFGEIHEISALAGFQQEESTKRYTEAQKTDPAKDNLHEISSGSKNPTAEGNKYHWRMLSYFGRINYALMNKYLFEANIRADGSSRFAKGNRWGYFPSFSVGWRLGEENFIKNLNIFDNLKLRASWGKLGNQNISTEDSNSNYFPYLTVLDQDYSNSYNYGGVLAPGAAITALVDPSITWETTTTTDIGIDLGFLKNRLDIVADYFNKKTTDIIVRLPIPSLLGGLSAPYQNIGKMINKGLEVNVTWQDKINKDLSYSVGGNFTYVHNRVTKFRGGKSPDQLYLVREGYSYNTLYGFIQEGVYQTDQEAKEHMYANGYTPSAGDLKYKDVNGDGKLDYQDKQEIGNTIPKFTYGFNGAINWKNFDLNFQFSGIAGVHGYFQNAWTEPLGISGGTITKRWRNAWTKENPSTTLPIIKVNDTWNRQSSSFWSCNMSWLKLKNIQLGYTLPKNISNRLSMQKCYIYLNATDLFTIVSDKYEGFDPERDTFDSGYDQYPIPRVFSLGFNITF